MEEEWAKFLSVISSFVKSFQLTAIFLKKKKEKEFRNKEGKEERVNELKDSTGWDLYQFMFDMQKTKWLQYCCFL